jgi:hypothetical protein
MANLAAKLPVLVLQGKYRQHSLACKPKILMRHLGSRERFLLQLLAACSLEVFQRSQLRLRDSPLAPSLEILPLPYRAQHL